MKYDKQYHVVCAVYRMLRGKRINGKDASRLLQDRAKLHPVKAAATVSVWMPSLRRRWALAEQGRDEWGQYLQT